MNYHPLDLGTLQARRNHLISVVETCLPRSQKMAATLAELRAVTNQVLALETTTIAGASASAERE